MRRVVVGFIRWAAFADIVAGMAVVLVGRVVVYLVVAVVGEERKRGLAVEDLLRVVSVGGAVRLFAGWGRRHFPLVAFAAYRRTLVFYLVRY